MRLKIERADFAVLGVLPGDTELANAIPREFVLLLVEFANGLDTLDALSAVRFLR